MAGFDAQEVKLGLSRAARWNSLTLPYLVERDGLDLNKPAIVFEGAQCTYGELREASRRVANALIGLGVEEMDRVALLSANRLEFFEVEVGIAAARAIMVPLNWRLRAGELANLLNRSQARAVFVEDRFMGTIIELRRSGELPHLRTVIALDGGPGDLSYEELLGSSSADRPSRQAELQDPHEIIFTSGTTGQPKGVVWTNGTVMWNSLQQVTDYQLGPQHSTYAIIDLYYIGGRHDFTWPILHQGGTVHVKPSSNFDAEEMVRYVSENGISHVLWVPTMLYEILVRAPSVTTGYWDDPELTERLIVDGWLHTGDMGHFDEDGFLFIFGRKGDMIISGGMNIFPSEIEDVLREHPAVADVAVIGLPHEQWGETVCAVIETLDGSVVDVQQLIGYCTKRLAGYKKPTAVHVVEEIPRTVGGKPKKFVLRERFAEAAAV